MALLKVRDSKIDIPKEAKNLAEKMLKDLGKTLDEEPDPSLEKVGRFERIGMIRAEIERRKEKK